METKKVTIAAVDSTVCWNK